MTPGDPERLRSVLGIDAPILQSGMGGVARVVAEAQELLGSI